MIKVDKVKINRVYVALDGALGAIGRHLNTLNCYVSAYQCLEQKVT